MLFSTACTTQYSCPDGLQAISHQLFNSAHVLVAFETFRYPSIFILLEILAEGTHLVSLPASGKIEFMLLAFLFALVQALRRALSVSFSISLSGIILGRHP